MSARELLPNRRKCLTLEFQHAGQSFKLSAGFFADGRVAEIFLSDRHVGSPLESISRDAAILCSLCLQFGCPIETVRSALTRDHDGSAATAISAAIDILAEAP